MVEFERVSFAELASRNGFVDVVREYAEETKNPAIAEPSVQFDRYAELDEQGLLRFVAAMDGGRLVGLLVVAVTPSQHYGFPIVAVESIYLRKVARRGAAGLELLGCAKAIARAEGAPGFTIMAPPGSALDRVAGALGLVNTHKAYWCHVE